jgi:glycosyltransferase involved in cell wall biosynthesis
LTKNIITYISIGGEDMRLLAVSLVNLARPGGDATHFREEMSRLVKLGIEVLAVVPAYSKLPPKGFGFPIKYVLVGKRSYFSFAWFQIKVILLLPSILKSFKPDVVYFRGIFLSFLFYPYFHLRKIPIFIEQNGLIIEDGKSYGLSVFLVKFVEYLDKLCSKHCDAIVCPEEALKEVISKRYKLTPDKILVLVNGANEEFFKPLPEQDRIKLKREYGFKESDYIVGFAGSLYRENAVDILVGAAAKLREEKSIKFLIVGEGPERPRIYSLVQKQNLEERFVFLGKVPYEEVPFLINIFDVGVVCKIYNLAQISPTKFLEHLFCGVPVIYTKNVLADQFSFTQLGFLVDPLNEETLACAIVDAFRLSKGLREKILAYRGELVERYSWNSYAKKLKFFLEKVLLLKIAKR